jgi:uncharacterized protein (DUF2132 family)
MSIESIVKTCNKQAMDYLCTNNYPECFRLLKKAEEIISSPNYPTGSKLNAVTLNNLGCYYKRINSYDTALVYLRRALQEEADEDQITTAGTHLNILAVLAQQNNHQQALYHGIQALNLLKNSKNTNTFIIALQSTADEYSALGNAEKALGTYKYALELSQQYLGPSDQHTQTLYNKIQSLSQPEKKFYFEKINKRATKQIFPNFRNSSILPKINGPIKSHKSQERTPQIRQKVNRKGASDRIQINSAPNKPKVYSSMVEKSKSNELKRNKLDSTYTKLEQKINNLQNQLEDFEVRYKQLENFAKGKISSKNPKKGKMSLEESVIMIQKCWRGYKDRQHYRVYRRKMTHERAKRAIEELEILRKEAIKEDLYGEDPRPKTNINEFYRTKYERKNESAYKLHRLSLKLC